MLAKRLPSASDVAAGPELYALFEEDLQKEGREGGCYKCFMVTSSEGTGKRDCGVLHLGVHELEMQQVQVVCSTLRQHAYFVLLFTPSHHVLCVTLHSFAPRTLFHSSHHVLCFTSTACFVFRS